MNRRDYEGPPHFGPGVADNVGGAVYDEFDRGVTNVPMSLHAWSWSVTRCLLRGRTSFSMFLRRSLGGCLGGPLDVAATALFPIPLLRDVQGVFGPQKFGKARRFRAAVRRMVHLAVMALNFLHCGGGLDYELLRRSPSKDHVAVYQRLEALIKAGGPPDSISIVGCGRKSFQLGARLKELMGCLQRLGLGEKSAYHQGADSVEVPLCNDKEELVPYRPLKASRLKLSGQGLWDCLPYIDPLFYMPFVEPRINQFDLAPNYNDLPNFEKVDRNEVLELCKVWDLQGLLRIYPVQHGPKKPFAYVKIFNNYKSDDKDRQIGDRRGANSQEGRLQGASSTLPTGVCLLSLCPTRYVQQLRGSVCDRRDYYHQFHISDQKASLNALFPPLRLSELLHLRAAEKFEETFKKKKARGQRREAAGDFLHLPGGPRPILFEEDPQVVACFGAILQGDHLGVEVATCSHAGLLMEDGFLQRWTRLESHVPIAYDSYVDGLVIDDVFMISKEEVKPAASDVESLSFQRLMDAKKVYTREALAGSDDKDVLGACDFKVCGVEVLSNEKAVSLGAVTVGAPTEKRLALAQLTALVSALPCTSDALHSTLVGSWISIALMRRQVMAVMSEVFHVIKTEELDTERPLLRRLSRGAAEEFQLLAALASIMVANLALPFDDRLFATDASLGKGGITVACCHVNTVAAGWRSADRKGKNLPLLSLPKAILASHDMFFEDEEGQRAEGGADYETQEDCPRPLGLRFQFLEVCGGAGIVTKKLIDLNVVCGPVFDLAISPQYDLGSLLALRWITHMMTVGRLDSFLVSPPCTTYSPAAHPCIRSYACPEGFDLTDERTLLGNLLAYHALCLLFVALRLGLFGLGEQPRRSKMRWLRVWRRLRTLGMEEVHLASCSFGSQHQKEFCFAGVNMQVHLLHRPCTRDHEHIRIQGRFTKPSATYVPLLGEALAVFFRDHLVAKQKARQRLELRTDGLEDQLSNELSVALEWHHYDSWVWRRRSHINVLETGAILRLMRRIAGEGGDKRILYLADSHVARSVVARGRSSAAALRLPLRKLCAVCLAFGIYPAGRFSPTRWNPSDHPTRDSEIPPPVPGFSLDLTDPLVATALATLSNLKRWASNWLRLSLLLAPNLLDLAVDPSSYRSQPEFFISPSEWSIDFDSTLGFPGEGPWFVLLLWISLWGIQVVSCVGASHGDVQRQKQRLGVELQDGRRVTPHTAFTREALLGKLKEWMLGEGFVFDAVIHASPPDVDLINQLLVTYGRWLFKEGKPFYHYCETLNGITTVRPQLRRTIQQAWDLAFMWGSFEPSEHHQAMPEQILIAVISVCWLWGWRREAAVFAMCWGALLRVGELLQAYRSDLITPEDVDFTINYILLKIKEPKTRYRAARHQSGKLEQADLCFVVSCGFQRLAKGDKLWQLSGSTLRTRLEKVLSRLLLPTQPGQFPKPLSLASFRPGGATWLIAETESAEAVRRKGRWAAFKTMEIYLQEVSSATYMNDITAESKSLVLAAFRLFPCLVEQVGKFNSFNIPEQVWFRLFASKV